MTGSSPEEKKAIQLSARQSLLWLDEQLYPHARYHNQVLAVELRGELDLARFQSAWRRTVEARDSFRLVVDRRTGELGESVLQHADLPVIPVDASSIRAWTAERCARTLLGPGASWEAALLRVGPDEHYFYLCQHQIAADPVSLLAVAEELGARYTHQIPPTASSFRDYLREEAAYRVSPEAGEDQAFWGRILGGGAPPLRPYGIVRTDRSVGIDRTWFRRGRDVAGRLATLAEQEPFRMPDPFHGRMIVMAAGLAAFLYRVTGNSEVLLGVPVANRSKECERTSGLLMEQLFLRFTLEPGDSFAMLAARIRESLREALTHGRACVSDRGMEYVTLHLLPRVPVCFGDLAARVELTPAAALCGNRVEDGDMRDTLGVVVHDFAETPLEVAFDFHRATWSEKARRRGVGHFGRMLDALTSAPEAVIDAVDLVDEAERAEVLEAAKGPDPGTSAPDLLVKLAEQVLARPEHLAVRAQDRDLTYAELDALSNQLARRMRKLGVVRESRVGVAVPRGAGELVTLLATLKAGAVYVPVDPTHPVDRVRVILEDAAPEVLVAPSTSPLAGAVPEGTKHLQFDHLGSATEGEDPAHLDGTFGGEEVAYILFTSGSTGRPKGVEVLRGALANFLRSMARAPGLTEGDRVVAITTTTFDIAGLELFLPLWVGATVVIADRDTALDPHRLRDWLEKASPTLMQATPATWRLLLEAGWKGGRGLRMLCGGEALSLELASRLLDGGGELWNVYGPTETTVWSTVDRVDGASEPISIGRPIDRTQVYVLDSALQVVPVGVVGEIFIGGDGLARGYRGRPDLTAERFVRKPFGQPGERLYRTGDLGRLLPDGRFECLGRVDHQVKVRGFRIELGEIESALRAVPGVKEVVVVAETRGGGDPRLVAYWVGEAERAAVFDQARRKLPPYMVPSGYLCLEALPLTTSGKVDRKALPPPEMDAKTTVDLIRPRNDLEVQLAAIWTDLLGVSAVGVDQDFFSLGGTSVLAIQARARIEKELGVELSLRAFFDTPTLGGIAGQIGLQASEDEPIIVRLRRGRTDLPSLFCLAGVQLYQDIALALDGERDVVGMHIPIRYDPSREPCPGVPEIARRYVEAIRRHQPQGPYYLAGLCFGGIVAFEVARQLEAEGQRVPVVAVLDGYMPGAIRVDQLGRFRAYMKKGLRDPASAAERLVRGSRRLLSWLGRRPKNGEPMTISGGAREGRIEVPIDGADVDAEALHYGRTAGRIAGQLAVFRATRRDGPSWIELTHDLGWSPHAARIVTQDIACDHLEIVRGRNALIVAEVLEAAMARDAESELAAGL